MKRLPAYFETNTFDASDLHPLLIGEHGLQLSILRIVDRSDESPFLFLNLNTTESRDRSLPISLSGLTYACVSIRVQQSSQDPGAKSE